MARNKCILCDRDSRAKGFCANHYKQYITPGVHKARKGYQAHKVCKILGCGQEYYAKGYCSKHWSYYVAYKDRGHREHNCIATGCAARLPLNKLFCSKHSRKYTNPIPRRRGSLHWSYKNGNSYFKDHYSLKQIRVSLIEERGYKCEKCEAVPTRLHVHHKDKNKNNHIKDNLQLLCPKCHAFYRVGLKNRKRQIPKYVLKIAKKLMIPEDRLISFINEEFRLQQESQI